MKSTRCDLGAGGGRTLALCAEGSTVNIMGLHSRCQLLVYGNVAAQ
jgi:hypothetical protein